MDFSFSEEQLLLQQTARRFIDREYPALNPGEQNDAGFNEKRWAVMCELGWTGLAVPEAAGGHGGSAIDVMLLCEQLGHGPVVEPYLSNLLAMQIIARCKSQPAASSLQQLTAGKARLSAALYEPGARFSLDCERTRANKSEDGWSISGHKTAVLYAQTSDQLIVAASLAEGNMGLFLVDAAAGGINIHPYPTLDGQQAAEVILEETPAEDCLASGQEADAILRTALDTMLIGLSAEALGAMEAALEMTLDYCKQRQQFGQPIGKFQAIRHKLADMYILCEGVRSLLYAAASKQAENDPDAHTVVAALKFRVADSGRQLAEQAVQLHGGIGFTEDLRLSRYYKRLVCIASLYGDRDHCLREYLAAKR